jgi:hypothetical protein
LQRNKTRVITKTVEIEKPVIKVVEKIVKVEDTSRIRELERKLAEAEKRAEAMLSQSERRAGTLQLETDSYKIYRDVFIDKKTNLMWEKNGDGKEYTWDEAKSYCENLRLLGFSNWRLPTDNEANSITGKDYKQIYQKKNTVAIWTSIKHDKESSLVVNFEYDWNIYIDDINSLSVICIRDL